MQTSAGIAEEEITLSGRSGHTWLAAAAVTMPATDNAAIRQIRKQREGSLLGTENDYNRRYPELVPFKGERGMVSRRDFGKLALAGIPLSAAWSASGDPVVNGVRVGVATYSYRDLIRTPGQDNIDGVIKALQFAGAREIELSSANTEPAGPNSGPAVPPPPSAYPPPITAPKPEEVAAAKLAVRNDLRRWRLATPAGNHAAIRAKFQAAGIGLFAYRVDYDAAFTDREIEVTFNQAKALGVGVVASLTTLAGARRLAPFAEKHGLTVALHNTADEKDPNAIATPQSFRTALAISKNFRLNLDIGHFTAANHEAVAFIQENHASISHIQIKDRTRNGGGNEKFGEGDTPIKDVLNLIREKSLPIPVFIEYEYLGLGTPQEEVRKCMAYVKAALA
jgi:sugar phosphate isomerase/epimerase